MPKKKINVMLHHILYEYNGVGKHGQIELKVPILTTEHHILTELQRRGKNVSKGFLDALEYFIWYRKTTKQFQDLSAEDPDTIQVVGVPEWRVEP